MRKQKIGCRQKGRNLEENGAEGAGMGEGEEG